MLRIAQPSSNGPRTLVLEGQLTRLWAAELLRILRQPADRDQAVLDLRGVSFIDTAGMDALRLLNKSGARFITDSSFGKDLCSRLKLRRMSGAEAEALGLTHRERLPEAEHPQVLRAAQPPPPMHAVLQSQCSGCGD